MSNNGPFFVEKSLSSYRSNLRANVRALWSGEWGFLEFYDAMWITIQRGFRQAWEEGAEESGIPFSELTTEELNRLRAETDKEGFYIDHLADFVEKNSKANKGKQAKVFQRVEQWVNTYVRITQLAKAMAGKDRKQKWTLHPAEHCDSCKRLDGKVKRASYWASHVTPKDWNSLLCRNGCKCTLEYTSDPMTPGPLPTLP